MITQFVHFNKGEQATLPLPFLNSPSHPQEIETREHKSYLLGPCLVGGISCPSPSNPMAAFSPIL